MDTSKATYELILSRVMTKLGTPEVATQHVPATTEAQSTRTLNPFACAAIVVACLFLVLALALAICHLKSSFKAVDASKIEPQPENSTSPLLFMASESARAFQIRDNETPQKPDTSTSNGLSSTMPCEVIAGESDFDLQPSKASKEVPLIWDTPNGERTTYARKNPLGVYFNAEFPLKVKREPQGHGKEIGIEIGWVLTSVNGIDVTNIRDIAKVSEILYKEVGEKTMPVEQWRRECFEPQENNSRFDHAPTTKIIPDRQWCPNEEGLGSNTMSLRRF